MLKAIPSDFIYMSQGVFNHLLFPLEKHTNMQQGTTHIPTSFPSRPLPY